MTELIKHPEFGTIRTEVINGEPWFCGKDVCRALGYENHKRALKMHCKEKGVTKRYSPTAGGIQEVNFINEGNLYRLILNSHLPAAEKFESWVCDEVLPSIRQTGEYRTPAVRGQKRRIRVTMDVMEFLWLIDENLQHGDRKMIALQIGVTEQSVSHVLSGQCRSPRVLRALYDRAIENRAAEHLNPYSREFMECAVRKLM